MNKLTARAAAHARARRNTPLGQKRMKYLIGASIRQRSALNSYFRIRAGDPESQAPQCLVGGGAAALSAGAERRDVTTV